MSLKTVFEKAALSFARAFGVAFLVASTGILHSPNLVTAKAALLAALVGALAAGFKAVQLYVPKLSFKSLFPAKYVFVAAWVDSFARAFVGTLLTTGVVDLETPNLHFSRALLLSLVVGALTAGLRAVQGFVTKGEQPASQTGAPEPNKAKA